jgi:hypothetical protein
MQKVFDNISCLETGTFHLSLPVVEDIFEERYFYKKDIFKEMDQGFITSVKRTILWSA